MLGTDSFSNYTVYNTPADGDCLYSTIGHQLGRGMAAAGEVRAEVTLYAKENMDEILKLKKVGSLSCNSLKYKTLILVVVYSYVIVYFFSQSLLLGAETAPSVVFNCYVHDHYFFSIIKERVV